MRRNLFFKVAIVILVLLVLCGCRHKRINLVSPPDLAIKTNYIHDRSGSSNVDIQYPGDNSTTTKKEIGVIAAVSAVEPVISVTVSVNDRQVKRLNIAGHQYNTPVEALVPLTQGKNRIAIKAELSSGKQVAKVISVERIIDSIGKSDFRKIREKWAVVIGISTYQFSKKGIPPIEYANNDAKAFMDFLRSPQGGGFKPASTLLLIDDQATTRNIRSGLYTFLKQAGKDDLVFIYFAGHGAPELGRPDNLYLITYDTDPEELAATAFPMWDMETALKRYIVAERVVIIADACHSGGIGGKAGLRNVGSGNLINTYLANLNRTKPGRAIITASEANELSRESKKWGGHGVFTYFLLRGLKGEADVDRNGIITIAEVFKYVYNKVRRATNSQQHPNIQGKFDRNLPLGVTK